MVRAHHRWTPRCPAPPRLWRPVRVDPTGEEGPTQGQARGPGWRRTSHGLYVPADVDGSLPEQRIMEQSARLPARGAVTGWAGCRLHGGSFFDGLMPDGHTLVPVPLATGGSQVRADDSVTVSRDRLPIEDVTIRYAVPCTAALRSVFDAMRTAGNLREAVVVLDMAAAAEITSIRRLTAYAARHPGWNGIPQVLTALPLASELSRSPNETRTRLVWVLDAGLPAPRVNQPVFDLRGNLLGIADLLDAEAGVAGEFDGADHRGALRHSDDVRREDLFRRHGLEVFRVTGPDLSVIDRVVARMHGARARARWDPVEHRRWTIVPPPWWDEAPCLDAILDRRDAVRALHEQQDALPDPDIREVRGW